MAEPDGPYLVAALFCTSFMPATMTVNQIIEGGRIEAPPPPKIATQLPIAIFLQLRAGATTERASVVIRATLPDGSLDQAGSYEVSFNGEHTLATIAGPFPYAVAVEGLYLFDVYVNERFATRMVFRVDFVSPPPKGGKSRQPLQLPPFGRD